MTRFTVPAVTLLLAFGAGTLQAQSPFTLQMRGGAAFPTADLGESALNTGAGFEFGLEYRLQPHLGVYLGWDWHRFTTDEAFAGSDFDVEDTGYAFGAQFTHPLMTSIGYWARFGGIYNHIELEDDRGDIAADSGHELGWEVGGGLNIPLGERFALTPGVRYRTFSTTLDVNDATVPVDLSWVAAEVGVRWSFGGRALAALRR